MPWRESDRPGVVLVDGAEVSRVVVRVRDDMHVKHRARIVALELISEFEDGRSRKRGFGISRVLPCDAAVSVIRGAVDTSGLIRADILAASTATVCGCGRRGTGVWMQLVAA